MSSPSRAMIFIDGSNCYFGLKSLGVSIYKMDFKKLANALLIGKRVHVRTFFYVAPVNEKEEPALYKNQQLFFNDLRNDGVDIRLGYLQQRRLQCKKCGHTWTGIRCPSCGSTFGKKQEKGVDVYLAVDLVYSAAMDEYDIAYVITSDGDQAEACRRAIEMGKAIFYVKLPPRSSAMEKVCNVTIKKGASFFENCFRSFS